MIVLNHVLEHVLDLRDFLSHLGRIAGGRALIQVPYHRGLIPRLMGDHWFAWAPDEHVWHFTPLTLARVVREASGLEPVGMTRKGRIEPPSPGMRGRAKKALAHAASRVGVGDEIEATFMTT